MTEEKEHRARIDLKHLFEDDWGDRMHVLHGVSFQALREVALTGIDRAYIATALERKLNLKMLALVYRIARTGASVPKGNDTL